MAAVNRYSIVSRLIVHRLILKDEVADYIINKWTKFIYKLQFIILTNLGILYTNKICRAILRYDKWCSKLIPGCEITKYHGSLRADHIKVEIRSPTASNNFNITECCCPFHNITEYCCPSVLRSNTI